MPLPKTLVYNDLSGDEVKHILIERFTQLLGDVPYLQRHITLPRVKMSLDIELICWADQNAGDVRNITDFVEVKAEGFVLQSSIDASTKGDPPDKVREDYGLGIPTPTPSRLGPLEDVVVRETVEGRTMTMGNGAVVDRTGRNGKAMPNATVVEQDFGSRLSRNGDNSLPLGNQGRRSGPVEPVRVYKDTD